MNTIRELKQQEKYKSMLKRKNKEKKIYKDKNASLQLDKQRLYIALRNKDKEIERLIISLQAQEELTMNEHIKVERLNKRILTLEETIRRANNNVLKDIAMIKTHEMIKQEIVQRLFETSKMLEKGSDKE